MRTLTAVLLVALAFPAAAEIHFSAESPISPAELAPTPANDAQIATDGETYVAVWTDYRRTPPSLYAARFRRDGTLLDPVGVPIAVNVRGGSVIWSGQTFVVAYQQEGVVRVRTFSPDGIAGAPIDLFATTVVRDVYKLRMATNGDSVLLVSQDAAAALLERDGRLRRRIDMPWPSAQSTVGVAAAGTDYLVAADAELKVKTQLVHANGDLGPQHTLTRGGLTYGVDVASDGERFLVSWARGHLQAVFFARDGNPIEPLLTLTPAEPVPFSASRSVIDLVWRGGEYLLVYSENSPYVPLRTLRVTASGTPAGPLFANDDWTIANVVTAPNGSVAVIGWNRQVLTGAFLDAQGASLRDETRVALAARSQRDVRLATVRGGIASAWLEWDLVAGNTLHLSRGPGSVSVLVSASAKALIDVVAENNAIWVLWTTEDATLYARRYTLALQPIDAAPVAVGNLDASYVDVSAAAGGGTVIVVSANPDVVAHVLRGGADGITSTVTEVASDPGLDHDPAVTWNGGVFVVAWANALGYTTRPPVATNDVYTGFHPDDRILTLQLDALGRKHVDAPVEIARGKAIETLTIAHGARGTAVAWQPYLAPDQSSRRHTYAAMAVPQSAVIDLGGQDMHLGAFTAHNGGFLLARAAANTTTRIAQPEVLELDANLRITDVARLAPYVIDISMLRKAFDADVIGGAVASFAYSRVAGDGYGEVARHFVRRLLESQRRRTSRK